MTTSGDGPAAGGLESFAVRRLAQQLHTFEQRLQAVERGSQLRHSSIEGGALAVNDGDGQPVLLVGLQDDGGYAVTGVNGGEVVATTLDIPDGSITETQIADDAISTPKLRANAVTTDKIEVGAITADKIAANAVTAGSIAADAITADKIAADALTGKTITGGYFRTASSGETLEIGEDVYNDGHAALRWKTDLGTWAEPYILGGENIGGAHPGEHQLELSGGAAGGRRAIVTLSDWRPSAQVQVIDNNGYSSFLITTDSVEIDGTHGGRLLLDGVDQGRGKLAHHYSTANSANVFAETAVLWMTGLTLKDGRAYRVRFGGSFSMTGAGITVFRLRDRTAGPFSVERGSFGHFPATQATNPFGAGGTAYLRRDAGSGDLTAQTLALTMQASLSGTQHVGTPTAPRFLEIEDCGAAADYPYAVSV